ncbi:MAG TPA: S53 family peptidase [Solirubrobacterales bacterium]|nr:S53 family peptidase [Solirubrobacterales bacterium]
MKPSRLAPILVLLSLLLALVAAPSATAKPAQITFYFGLKRPEAAARAAYLAATEPGSPGYRHFLSAKQAAARYGASAATAKRFRRLIARRGMAATLDSSRVFARVRGTVPQMARLIGRPIKRSYNNDDLADVWFPATRKPLRLPRALRPLVRGVVASYSRSAKPSRAGSAGFTTSFFSATSGAAARGKAKSQPPANDGTWTEGCAAARKLGAYSFAQVRKAYGIDALGSGAGARVAILNVGEGVPAADLAANAKCFGYPKASVRTLLSDGQAKPFGRGLFEAQEDLALVRGMAPGLRSLTFSQAWLPPELWFLGAAGVLDAGSLPDSFSISYGECETLVRGKRASAGERAGADLMDALLVRLGLAGVASFASAGDSGSTCNGQPFSGVAWPGSSPYLTAVGGTRLSLNAANERVGEVVWNDLQWLEQGEGGGAGGGGFSRFSPRLPYQAATGIGGSHRTVPDLSAHASMLPGWPVVLAGNWVEDAGTSSSAPLLASAFAVLSAAQRRAGLPPLGPVDGLLYSLRASAPQTIFDVTEGNNGFLPKVHAFPAKPGYDLASGLGVPNFAALAAALPPPGL